MAQTYPPTDDPLDRLEAAAADIQPGVAELRAEVRDGFGDVTERLDTLADLLRDILGTLKAMKNYGRKWVTT